MVLHQRALDKYGMNNDRQDKIICQYSFVITAKSITNHSKSSTSPSRKALLIKIGSKSVKIRQMNSPAELIMEVLYSNALQRFCPVKGIIKLYDLHDDGTEIISCVDGFQAEGLLDVNKNSTQVVFEKEVGTCKIALDMLISVLAKKSEKDIGVTLAKTLETAVLVSKQKTLTNLNPKPNKADDSLKSSPKKRELLGSRQRQSPRVDKNHISAQNSENINSNNLGSWRSEMLERSIEATVSSKSKFQAGCSAVGVQGSCLEHFRLFVEGVQASSSQQFYEIDLRKKFLIVRFKQHGFQMNFRKFYQFMLQMLGASSSKNQPFYKNSKDQSEPQVKLKKEALEQDRQLAELQIKLSQKNMEIKQLQTRNQEMRQKLHKISESNARLREKCSHFELVMFNSENILQQASRSLQARSAELNETKSQLHNCKLRTEELNEEIENLLEKIDSYEERYGEIKGDKNKTIQFEIKECLRWIDQQNIDNPSLACETMPSKGDNSLMDLKDDSLCSVIRKLEIDDKVPAAEMRVIREELVRILEKVDRLMLI